jgi:hypothetical protein
LAGKNVMKNSSTDFSVFLNKPEPTHKGRLIQQCQKRKISIYMDDSSEISFGVYAMMRSVASEAELERRLNSSKAVTMAFTANVIATISLFIAIAAFVNSLIKA